MTDLRHFLDDLQASEPEVSIGLSRAGVRGVSKAIRIRYGDTEKLIAAQSKEADVAKRKAIVWQIERKLAEDVARPVIQFQRAATCWYPHVKGVVLHQNSIYNGARFEDVWLDK